jgi:hypothetical protein
MKKKLIHDSLNSDANQIYDMTLKLTSQKLTKYKFGPVGYIEFTLQDFTRNKLNKPMPCTEQHILDDHKRQKTSRLVRFKRRKDGRVGCAELTAPLNSRDLSSMTHKQLLVNFKCVWFWPEVFFFKTQEARLLCGKQNQILRTTARLQLQHVC